jgi:toxin CptA
MTTDASITVAWRPSCWVVAAQLAFGVFGAIGLVVSALPRGVAVPGAVVALLAGVLQAIRHAGRPPRLVRAAELDLHWRGPLAFDVRHGLSWWPDTLDARGRRALRLATSRRE